MSFEPEEISLKLDKSLTRADVENLLEQQGDSQKLNLSGLNLSVVDFAEMDLSGAAFAYAHLNGANLLNANLENTNLNSARLNGVKGRRARLNTADLANASLIEAKLEEASFSGSLLSKANFSGADLRRANFAAANLSEANLSEANLSEANLSEANLSQANLSRADLRDTDLRRTDLRGAVLGGAKLDGATLDGANLSQVRLLLANLHKARFSEAVLNEADFSWSNLSEANLSRADLTGAKLIEADLTGADLREANLQEANLSGANLSGTLLVGAKLGEANLSGATLSGAYLSDEQKELLAAGGDVLGLDETRSAADLAELEASRRNAAFHTSNGMVHSDREGDLTLSVQTEADLEVAASLPSLEEVAGDITSGDPLSAAESAGPAALAPLASFQTSFVDPPLSTVSLVVKETPLSAAALAALLGGLDRLHTALNFIREEKFAELVEFYRSPGVRPAPADGALTVQSFDAATGQIVFTATDPGAFPAFISLLAGVSRPAEETSPAGLAESALDDFTPDLDPALRAIAAQPLVDCIGQLAVGPRFDVALPPESAGAGPEG